MNVKELREYLENFSDDAPVVLDNPDYAGSKFYEVRMVNSEEGVERENPMGGKYWREPNDGTSEELVVLS